MDRLFNDFKNPTPEYRGKPFWSWNGRLEKDELLRQVHVMKEMGFGGFFMHSRTGLETEYLGDEWFDLINACADEAEKLGMEAWLYDEDRWPSGIAGGMVTENPEFRMKSIRLSIMDNPEAFEWTSDITAAFACRLEGVNLNEYERINYDTRPKVYEGKQVLVFKVNDMALHSFYNGYTYVDTMNKKATERFIELTHEKYRQRCGNRLGRSIKGIFTDEPNRGILMDEFGSGNECDIWRAPWTPLLTEEFMKKFGYDIIEKLPELFLKKEGKGISQVKWHYNELLQQMFLDNFAKPINEWCENNKIILTGHILHEDSLTAQTATSGSVMRYYEHMGYPGVDLLTENNKAYWVAKQLSSVARQLGKKWLLSELYGCTGWQMDFEGHKAVGDWQALFGINLRCHHLSWYTMEGEAKRDYPASILHQSTWWKEYKYVEDYFSRIGLLMSQGKPCCDILVMNPVESVWSQVHPGWAKMLGAKAPEIKELEEKYMKLFHWLSGVHIDFDYGDEDILSRHYSIERDADGNALLKVGDAYYKVVVISGMSTVRSSTLRVLEAFSKAGGKLVLAGAAPTHIDALEVNEVSEILHKAVKVAFEKESITNAVREYEKLKIDVLDSQGRNIEDIFCQMREDGRNKYIMFLNVNREKQYSRVKININTSGNVEEWICTTGERLAAVKQQEAGALQIITDFEPCKEHLYVITQKEETQLQHKQELIETNRYTLNGPYAYELDEPNVCVLDLAGYKLDDGEWQLESEILKVDQALRNTFGMELRGGEMLQPWFAKKKKFEVKGKLALRFDFYTEVIPEGQVELVLERPENYIITVNGILMNNRCTNGWWIDKCFNKIALPAGVIKTGKNTVELKADFHEGINLETIYIAGPFGVRLEKQGKTLTKLPGKLAADDLTKQGLPFYSGKVRYIMNIPEKPEKNEKAVLSVEKFEAACIKVLSKSGADKIIAWQPYEAEITDAVDEEGVVVVEAVLTRRNTFGPLHQLPLIAEAYGPGNFVTEGVEFTRDYMLIPSGILEEPVIKICRADM